jgi:hypothetical protein
MLCWLPAASINGGLVGNVCCFLVAPQGTTQMSSDASFIHVSMGLVVLLSALVVLLHNHISARIARNSSMAEPAAAPAFNAEEAAQSAEKMAVCQQPPPAPAAMATVATAAEPTMAATVAMGIPLL